MDLLTVLVDEADRCVLRISMLLFLGKPLLVWGHLIKLSEPLDVLERDALCSRTWCKATNTDYSSASKPIRLLVIAAAAMENKHATEWAEPL